MLQQNASKITQVKSHNSTEKQGNYLMTMTSVIPVPFWIILNLLSFVSSDISSQRFVLRNALSISTKSSDVTEIESGSIIDRVRECKRNNLCHRASSDILTKRSRISNDQTSKNCGV